MHDENQVRNRISQNLIEALEALKISHEPFALIATAEIDEIKAAQWILGHKRFNPQLQLSKLPTPLGALAQKSIGLLPYSIMLLSSLMLWVRG